MKNYLGEPLYFNDGCVLAVRGDVTERVAKRLIKAAWMDGDSSSEYEYDISLRKPLKRGFCYENGSNEMGCEWTLVYDSTMTPEGVPEPLAVWYFRD